MTIKLFLKGKNKKSLIKTILFLNYYLKITALKNNIGANNKKIKKQKIVLLRSPHVNKSAQSKFYTKLFTTKYGLFLKNFIKFNLVLKKINKNLFHDINFIVKFQLLKNLKLNNFITFFFFKINTFCFNNLFFKNNLVRKKYFYKIIKTIKIIKTFG